MEKILMVELTEEELAMIMKERARAEKQRKREAYVDELNDLIKRAKADGFTIATNHPFKSCESVSHAVTWTDAAGNYIGLR
jgi:hypothetical protein